MPAAVPAEERVELAAMEDLVAAAEPAVARDLGVAGIRAGNAFAFTCDAAPTTELNRALGVTAVDELAAVEAFLRERRRPFWISPIPDSGLDAELERRGYARDYRWMKFSRRTGKPLAAGSDLAIREVRANRSADFASVFCAAYGLPDSLLAWAGAIPGRERWICLVSYDGDRPVGTGALFVDDDAGWLGMAATLPEARGRGSQTAILAYRITAAAAQGCTLVVTETGERVAGHASGSYRNILRAGFDERYLRANYRSP